MPSDLDPNLLRELARAVSDIQTRLQDVEKLLGYHIPPHPRTHDERLERLRQRAGESRLALIIESVDDLIEDILRDEG